MAKYLAAARVERERIRAQSLGDALVDLARPQEPFKHVSNAVAPYQGENEDGLRQKSGHGSVCLGKRKIEQWKQKKMTSTIQKVVHCLRTRPVDIVHA